MDLKALLEQRNALIEDMSKMFETAEAEKRAFNDEESKKSDEMMAKVKELDATIKKAEELRALEKRQANDGNKEPGPANDSDDKAEVDDTEIRAFDSFIRSGEIRAAADGFEKASNGVIIPKTIANKIIETVEDICPIFAGTTKYSMKGELVFPVYDESTEAIVCTYQTEFKAMTASKAGFKSVSLNGHLAGALTKVSISLINNSQFDLVSYVVSKVALAISRFLERECLIGTSGKMQGALSSTNVITAAKANAVTADELIDLQASIKDALQDGCCWTMHKDTLTAIRKLKDNDGNYLLNRDITKSFGWQLLGKPVYLSDKMPKMEAGNAAILYGDYSGLYTKLAENVSIQVLNEKYIDEHVIGVIAWLECDSKIVEPQKLAVLTMKSGT